MGRKKRFSSNKKLNYTIHRRSCRRRTNTPLSLKTIQDNLIALSLPKGWILVTDGTDSNYITLSHLQIINGISTVTHTITILPNLTYILTSYNHLNVKLPNPLVINDTSSIVTLINHVTSLNVCPGISDSKYCELADTRGGIFLNRQG